MTSSRAKYPESEPTVEAIMARVVAGDDAAIFVLAEFHGHRIAGEVRRQLRVCGVDSVAPEDLQSLVLDACMALVEVARAWNPDGGALPWIWARDRVREAVIRWVGIHADSLDARPGIGERAADSPVVSVDEEAVEETFARLVEEVPIVGLVADACRIARVPEPAMYCLLEYRIQQDAGDPSPANTLAQRYGVSPQTLRQRVSRNRRRLAEVVHSHERFAPLADFVFVA